MLAFEYKINSFVQKYLLHFLKIPLNIYGSIIILNLKPKRTMAQNYMEVFRV